jgi:tetratricopeptide (TPR) repeat protein
MDLRPIIFVSATSDLRSARLLVESVLHKIGYEPHTQDNAPTDGGELLAVLRRWIDPSDVVIQLVGQRYGAEPPRPTKDFGRVSYTQFEARYAEQIGKKVIYQFIEPSFPVDPAPLEPGELTQLQAQYRRDLKDANKLRYRITSHELLELYIFRLRNEFPDPDKVAEKWREVIREEIRKGLEPKLPVVGQSRPEPFSPEVLEKAQFLAEFGDAADKALALIVHNRHDEADRIIQELKSKPGNPIDDAVRLLMMEGDNWFRAGQMDKAIDPYEQALALRPKDVQTRTKVAVSHNLADLGDSASHRRRAIEIAEGTLQLVSAGSAEWALTLMILGDALAAMATEDRDETLIRAIDAYEKALIVFTKDDYPFDWAQIQVNLGHIWERLPGDRGTNLRRAIDAYELALTAADACPAKWVASVLVSLFRALADMPTEDLDENLIRAIDVYETPLKIMNLLYRFEWAQIQVNLGHTWGKMPGDRGKNLRRAIDAYEAALTVYTKEAHAADWARTQKALLLALGLQLPDLPKADRCNVLQRAIASGKGALRVWTPEAFPEDHAKTQELLKIIRGDYESAGCAAKTPFDDIQPAK